MRFYVQGLTFKPIGPSLGVAVDIQKTTNTISTTG